FLQFARYQTATPFVIDHLAHCIFQFPPEALVINPKSSRSYEDPACFEILFHRDSANVPGQSIVVYNGRNTVTIKQALAKTNRVDGCVIVSSMSGIHEERNQIFVAGVDRAMRPVGSHINHSPWPELLDRGISMLVLHQQNSPSLHAVIDFR